MQFAKNANLKSQFVTSKYKDKLDIPIWNFKHGILKGGTTWQRN